MPWDDIADIGNYLRHQYHDLNGEILWDVTREHDLDDHKAAVEAMNPNAGLARHILASRMTDPRGSQT